MGWKTLVKWKNQLQSRWVHATGVTDFTYMRGVLFVRLCVLLTLEKITFRIKSWWENYDNTDSYELLFRNICVVRRLLLPVKMVFPSFLYFIYYTIFYKVLDYFKPFVKWGTLRKTDNIVFWYKTLYHLKLVQGALDVIISIWNILILCDSRNATEKLRCHWLEFLNIFSSFQCPLI